MIQQQLDYLSILLKVKRSFIKINLSLSLSLSLTPYETPHMESIHTSTDLAALFLGVENFQDVQE